MNTRAQAAPIDRLMAKVDKVSSPIGCWIFLGFKNSKGYGQIGNGARGTGISLAHRLSFHLHNGEIPRGLFVLHRCDTPACCNPAHLFLGTNKDNCDDRDAKNRVRHGEAHPRARLSEVDIASIRAMAEEGALQREIAEKYQVSSSYISQILSFARRKRG